MNCVSQAGFARVGIRAFGITLFHVTLALFAMASFSSANADMLRFWEEDGGKPSVTGHAPKARAKKARLPQEEAANDGDDAPVARKKRRVRVASRGNDAYEPRPAHKSVTGGGGLTWAASSGCLNGTLISLVQDVASSYGPVTVSSTCRSKGHNASVGGAQHSHHLTGDAVDFRVHGNVSGAIAFLRSNGSVGGFHHYGGGLFHIDTGPKRTW
jgi:hypothetical protein